MINKKKIVIICLISVLVVVFIHHKYTNSDYYLEKLYTECKNEYAKTGKIEDIYAICDYLLYSDKYDEVKTYYPELLKHKDKMMYFDEQNPVARQDTQKELFNNLFWSYYVLSYIRTDEQDKLLDNTQEIFSMFASGEEDVYKGFYLTLSHIVGMTLDEKYNFCEILASCANVTDNKNKIYIYTMLSQIYSDLAYDELANQMMELANDTQNKSKEYVSFPEYK